MEKNYLWIEIQEGGAQDHWYNNRFILASEIDVKFDQRKEKFLKWSETAKVGDVFEFSMGWIVVVNSMETIKYIPKSEKL